MPVCTKCGEKKPVNEFNKDKKNKSGLSYRCKECQKKYLKKYRENEIHKIKAKQYRNEYYIKNKDHILKKTNEYKLKNKDHILKCAKEYYNKNKDHIIKRSKEQYKKNRSKINDYFKEYYKKNKAEINDVYIKGLITVKSPLMAADIPPEFIELKRAEIKLKRLIKEKSNV